MSWNRRLEAASGHVRSARESVGGMMDATWNAPAVPAEERVNTASALWRAIEALEDVRMELGIYEELWRAREKRMDAGEMRERGDSEPDDSFCSPELPDGTEKGGTS